MRNKKFFKSHYILFPSLTLFILMLLISCSEDSTTSPESKQSKLSFSNFFIEKGSDSDTSYISFRGTEINPDSLEIQATGWGIIETGLLLGRINLNKEIQFRMMARCGAITTRTYKKVTLKGWITAEETDTLQALSFANYRDTIRIVKTSIF